MSAYRDPENIMDKSFIEIIKNNTIDSAVKKRIVDEQESEKISKKLLTKVNALILKASKEGKHTINYWGPTFFKSKKWTSKVRDKLCILLREEGFSAEIKTSQMDYSSGIWIEISWKELCLPSD